MVLQHLTLRLSSSALPREGRKQLTYRCISDYVLDWRIWVDSVCILPARFHSFYVSLCFEIDDNLVGCSLRQINRIADFSGGQIRVLGNAN